MSKAFGKHLRKLRREKTDYSQQQIAEIINISRSTYTYYETGKTKPDINTLIKIAKVYNINYTALLEGVEEELEAAVADIVSGPADDDDSLKYRTHATTKYEVELLFVVRNLTPKQRKEVMALAKKLVSESELNK